MSVVTLILRHLENDETVAGSVIPKGSWVGQAMDEDGMTFDIMTQGTEFEHDGKGVELMVNFWIKFGWDPHLIREENVTFVTSVSAQTDAEKIRFPYFAGGLSPAERDSLIRESLERRAKEVTPEQGAKLFVK